MHRKWRSLPLVVCFAALPFSFASGQQLMCQAASGLLTHGVAKFTRIITASDSGAVTLRSRLHLSTGTANEVVVVADSATCQAAATAMARASSTDPNQVEYPVFVLKIGTSRYVVFGPDYTVGEFFAYQIFDDSFNHLASLAN